MNFTSIINDVCCDSRIKDGIVKLDDANHVFVLQEYLEKAGYDINEIVEKTSTLFEAGRFPERQAYNKDGILVTFPTKEYRDRAVSKGTHFAENPKKNTGTLYAPGTTGDLSTADIEMDDSQSVEDDEIEIKDKEDVEVKDDEEDNEEDSVSLDQELDNKVTGDDNVDNRTRKEKFQDSEAVDYILTNDPLQNYSVNEDVVFYTIDEAKELGYTNMGLLWFDETNKLVGEQLYSEQYGEPLIYMTEAPGCNAQKMEIFIDQELNNINSNDQTAKIIADTLRKKDKISKSQELGSKTCPISNVYFSQLNKTSKTDLVFNNDKRVSMKYEIAQLCSAQNLEMNSVISAVLTENKTESKVLKDISSFIMDGLKKDFYIGLKKELKDNLHKSLTNAIKSGDESELVSITSNIENVLTKNKKYLEDGVLPINVNTVLAKLNNIFTNPQLRHQLIEELATGKRRFQQGKADFSAICIADYMMTWNCTGQYKLYTVDQFIDQNQNNINFRFSNRGGVRGISLRGDIKTRLEETNLDEISLSSIKDSLSSLLSSDILELIKTLSEKGKQYFNKMFQKIKSMFSEILEYISKIGRIIAAYIEEGYLQVMEFLGFESQGFGKWKWQSPIGGDSEMTEN